VQNLGENNCPQTGYWSVKKNFVLGAGPQMGSGITAGHRGICRPWRVLPYRTKISANISKVGEILREKKKYSAPPSGRMLRRRRETGPKYSKGPWVLQVRNVW